MSLEFAFIPGFTQTLQTSPAALEARSKLTRTIVALVVTQESRSEYAAWAESCLAQRSGLSGEDIVFAQVATALDGREAAIARLAHIIARTGCFDPDEVRRLSRDPMLCASDVVEIVANAALAVLDNYLIQGLAPAKTHAA